MTEPESTRRVLSPASTLDHLSSSADLLPALETAAEDEGDAKDGEDLEEAMNSDAGSSAHDEFLDAHSQPSERQMRWRSRCRRSTVELGNRASSSFSLLFRWLHQYTTIVHCRPTCILPGTLFNIASREGNCRTFVASRPNEHEMGSV